MTITTQQTSKKWKAMQLGGALLLIVAVVARIGTGDYWWTGVGVVGVLLYALGRILAWWNNG